MNISVRNLSRNLILLIFGVLIIAKTSLAKNEHFDIQVVLTIQGTGCVVNNNQAIEINFGEMSPKNINGKAYEKVIPFDLQCNDPANTQYSLYFGRNNGADFVSSEYGVTLLATSNSNLGLMIKRNGVPYPFNFSSTITEHSKQKLSVVPVVNQYAKLDIGPFTASASMVLEYY
ncbi:fimbrial protein [[Haemophilus] ducreyi]|uniref:fimbrial protein n=1 Tax=Haemophilus ducreyi TaxID=730 RepID=UPI0007CDE1EA|nr:fimbrial protein [[Haemophilus] ducreyi]ANF61778.1 hypothetical protein A6037_02960 [[Haemophilus] ducreyi]ANF68322.1 hypothetical protein A6041_07245 [[Haemophilus] ducreyi]ANF69124.1 hypothetical protein A6042_03860 [[Haemophilus] ducreyi]OOS03697.1 hypothetical protein B0190_04300 [[Haemophilus] ducreyi]SEV99846.1 Pilin (type 1 fimbria component protein) [[Haemophilus] ducreyi]